MKKLDLSPVGLGRVVLGTVGGTLFCILTALLVDSFNFSGMTHHELTRSVLTDILLPLFLAGPLLGFLLFKMRQLALTQRELSELASKDSLTEIYNRGAFKMLVDAYLDRAGHTLEQGAFLVVDADHFKSINDRFGHDRGDQALRIIAETISDLLRGSDLVGRIGGEEFAVFLPGATTDQASAIAERIRDAVSSAPLPIEGGETYLSVSVGGVVYRLPARYEDLFRAADRSLYAAKSAGRNVVMIGSLAA
ncbi:MAG: GGDEF domain-containing protein [Candidatus Devosia phytovorans]|uniref:diguanylate cyclase n=1 Tax=Candidatus Devosia phytovorans TaxID=3121372 RepID=A0AAJ5VTD6_9HYPH|nr:GGDEF domain-containing protein [Devosia sp.]WEK03257.1 MAG: GGDEF domain-containing protein [Devosia sp.]